MKGVVDIGPLTWVKSEIDSSLERAQVNLAAFAADVEDGRALKAAKSHLHQAYGAVQIVGLEGLSRFFEETERLVVELETGRLPAGDQAFDLLERAIRAIGKYLADLLDGVPDQPLRLFSLHKELAGLRGAKDVSEADLYFPDLSLQPPPRDTPPLRLAAVELEAFLRAQRTRFQRSLLKWLKLPDDKAALADMLGAIEGIESTQVVPAQRSFWWTAGALCEALAEGSLAPESGVKQICSKIEQQMRRTLENAGAIPERLMRELLYWVAKAGTAAPSSSERVRDAQLAFRLEGTLPSAVPAPDTLARSPAVLREHIAAAKDAWSKYVGGVSAALDTFEGHARKLKDQAAQSGSAEFAALAREIAVVAAYLLANQGKSNDATAMEVATSLLLLEGVTEDPARLPAAFDAQSRAMQSRLRGAVFGKPATDREPGVAQLDEIARRAQEKPAVAAVVAEMQANLHKIEQALDAYFRDPAKAAGLAALEPVIHQVSGALSLLGEDAAVATLARCRDRVMEFSRAATRPALEQFEEVAQVLSGLGFYIESLRHGGADFAAAMEPIAVPTVSAPEIQSPEPVEAEEEALDIKPPIAAPSADAQRLRSASDETIDQELLTIFLEEAVGVLQTIARSAAASRSDAANLGELTVIRRAFHTLKGSGRMVGLLRFAEAALAVEQVINLWVREERPPSESLFELISFAHGEFAEWIRRLRLGRPQFDPQPILDKAEQVRRSEPAPPATLVPDAARATPPPAEAAASPAADGVGASAENRVSIGSISISASLFAVFTNEARQHIETLERELARAAADPAEKVRDELVRAAHTLAGICGTVQIAAMYDLGGALEAALLRLQRYGERMDAPGLALANESVGALKLMYAGVMERAVPGTAASLIERLGAMAERVRPAAEDAVQPGAAIAELEEQEDDRRQRRLEDEVDAQLLPVFLDEAAELAPQIGALLRAWRLQPTSLDPARALQRALHTLKGSARMTGVMSVGELTHEMETRVENAVALNVTPPQLFDDLEAAYDRMGLLLERQQRVAGVEPSAVAPAVPAVASAAPAEDADTRMPLREEGRTHGMMRVRADALEKLVNEAGEVAITRSRIETEMRGLKAAMTELTENVARLRRELREIEIAAESQLASRMLATQEAEKQFDPLEFDRYTRFQELTRMMAESVNDVATVQQTLHKVADDTDAALAAQARLNRELQQDLMRIRMVPIGSIADRLHRIVRQTSKELGKRANLDIRGANVELDRSALERITGPLEHLLRNSLIHGLEMPQARRAQGKAEMGEIALEVRQEGNEVTLLLVDDGAGLDLERIRAKAIDQGLIGSGESRSDQELSELIFVPGLSTADQVSALAGRGVGMDVVKNEVSGLGGRIELAAVAGRGTSVTIRLPLTTAVIQAVLVRVGGRTYALPAVMIDQVQQMRFEQLARAKQSGAVEWAGRRYPLHSLLAMLGEHPAVPAAEQRRYTPVLLIRSGVDAIAVEVEDMLGNQEVVVKNIGPQLARVPGIAGATVLGTGEIVLILNPVPLASRPAQSLAWASRAQPPSAPVQRKVMVVDDSLTVRKITGRLLSREGYVVLTAKDGVDALEQLAEVVPDVMLVDIEMPRMDGFDLTRNVRGDARLKGVPIIMITSRTAEKHKSYAMDLGVNAFLGKPYREDELLGHISGFVGRG